LIAFGVLAVLTAWLYQRTPTGFLPTEDQGYVIIAVQLPDAASLERTRDVMDRMNQVFATTEGVRHWFVLGGFSLLDGTNASNAATAFAAWSDWSQRRSADLSQDALVGKLSAEFSKMQEPFVLVLIPPSIQGLGVAGGFQMQVEDREGVGTDILAERTQAIIDEARMRSDIGTAATTFRAGVPQLYLSIDRVKVERMGVLLSDVFSTLQANLGSVYVNDFNKFDRTYQVRVQADARFRGDPGRLRLLEVRNRDGKRVPLSTLLSPEIRIGPQSITRYNLYQSASINGSAALGVSSGEALQQMEEIANQVLPRSMGFEC
jgi:HAE1 family hydrophobic/amphiphilic exporter-1